MVTASAPAFTAGCTTTKLGPNVAKALRFKYYRVLVCQDFADVLDSIRSGLARAVISHLGHVSDAFCSATKDVEELSSIDLRYLVRELRQVVSSHVYHSLEENGWTGYSVRFEHLKKYLSIHCLYTADLNCLHVVVDIIPTYLDDDHLGNIAFAEYRLNSLN